MAFYNAGNSPPSKKKHRKKMEPSMPVLPDSSAPQRQALSMPDGKVLYRLTLDEVPNSIFERGILLSIDLRDTISLFEIGKQEEEIYNHVARKIADYTFSQKDEIRAVLTSLQEIARMVEKGDIKQALKKTGCSSFRSYLDVTKNSFDTAQDALRRAISEVNALKAVSRSGQDSLTRILSVIEVGVKLFREKIPKKDILLLRGLEDRYSSLLILHTDFTQQQTQIGIAVDTTRDELCSLREAITGIIAQLFQTEELHKPELLQTVTGPEWIRNESRFVGILRSLFS